MLDVIDLNIEFNDHEMAETVVYDFDLHMEMGEIVGLVGESGSGKSMSALAIAGLLSRKDMTKRGSIMFCGTDMLKAPRNEIRKVQGDDIAMIFQEPMSALNPLKKIGWQVEESLRIHKNLTKEVRKALAIKMLEEVELDDPESIYNKYPHELSGGMRQRVMIASALICEPKLLIADEPTTALDVNVQEQILKLLIKINREKGTAILFISHDLSVVSKLCKRVVVMYNGRIVEEGLTNDVFDNPKEEYTKTLIKSIPTFTKL